MRPTLGEFHTALRGLQRQFPSALPVNFVGYEPAKDRFIETRTFNCCAFSFVLSGSGTYAFEGAEFPVHSPCVLVQLKNVHVAYGPRGLWEELYLAYPPDLRQRFEAAGILRVERPIWRIRQPERTRRLLGDLFASLNELGAFGVADRIDRICEAMLVESLISEAAPAPSSREAALYEIRAHVDQHFLEAIDFARLARRYGFTMPTFRRHWDGAVGMPPRRYMGELRMQHACRLLMETDLDVLEIAQRVGFEDALYFSRRFRRHAGCSPSAYRRRNVNPLSLLTQRRP
jgi:AraC family transcriptional regulator, arabinose operon regulatory protein